MGPWWGRGRPHLFIPRRDREREAALPGRVPCQASDECFLGYEWLVPEVRARLRRLPRRVLGKLGLAPAASASPGAQDSELVTGLASRWLGRGVPLWRRRRRLQLAGPLRRFQVLVLPLRHCALPAPFLRPRSGAPVLWLRGGRLAPVPEPCRPRDAATGFQEGCETVAQASDQRTSRDDGFRQASKVVDDGKLVGGTNLRIDPSSHALPVKLRL